MTPEQLAQLRERLAANRQPVSFTEKYAHPRGWNDAFDFVERVLREVLGEPIEPPRANS